jgi:phage terminase small subunit
MGKRGPAPQPTALKIARGNPGKRALNHDEPELAVAETTCPTDLTGRAAAEWNRLAPELVAKGVLTVGDMAVFKTYCQLTGELEAWTKRVAGCALRDEMRMEWEGHVNKLRTQHRQHAAEIGLTPSRRSGVKAAKRADPADERRKRFFGIPGGQQKA